ncbi:MAG: hypothetical protein ABSF94_14440 [Steroidobacteraceae bacterium]|jgi:hypothetical protein
MLFRLRAFGLHLLGSATALTLVLGTLYLGWYAWPGWYLCDAKNVVIVLMGVDLALGPSLTLIIANPRKPGRVLARDVSIIVAVQLIALTYGSIQLWTGRPLYYAFSESVLQAVQAYDLAPDAVAVAEQQNSPLRPHWNSLPRWIWAPLPQDATLRKSIVKSAIGGGPDVIEMPQYFRPWQEGLEQLRQKLKPVGEVGYFTKPQKILLKERMQADGLATDQANSIPLTGRGFPPLLAVFDPKSLQFKEYVSAK